MHILDLIMYFVIGWIIEKIYGEEGLGGIFVMMIYTIVYIILFAIWPDWNWADLSWTQITHWFKW